MSMRIVQLVCENVKRVVAVDITPSGDVVVIGGPNGGGKTSTLDSIMYALAGGTALPEDPVRHGAAKATIKLDLGDLIVTREISPDGKSALKVKTKAGVPQKSPQAILDELTGNLSFDPTEFARMKPKDQLDLLKRMVQLDTQSLDDAKAAATSERTEVGRVVRQLEGQLVGMPFDSKAPKEPKSAIALQEDLRRARDLNRIVESYKTAYTAECRNVIEGQKRLDELHAQVAKQEALIAEAKENRAKLVESIETAPRGDEDSILKQIDGISAINAAVMANSNRAKVEAELKKQSDRYNTLTLKIEEADTLKADRMAAASSKMPVPSLSFDDMKGVLAAGVPFNQASAAEQLRISMAVGMALNPKLRVILIRDGSLLDANSMKIVAEMAARGGFQVWCERVGDGDEQAVIIEEGRVRQ